MNEIIEEITSDMDVIAICALLMCVVFFGALIVFERSWNKVEKQEDNHDE